MARIAPLYWVVTLTAAATAIIMPTMLHSTRFDPSHVLASMAFVPWPNPAAEGRSLDDLMTPVIVPGWTLNFEMMFYALFGVTLIGPRKRRLGQVVALFTLFIAAVVMFGPRHLLVQFYDPFLIVEFLLGVAAGVLIERTPPMAVRQAVPLLVVVGAALLILDSLSPPISRLFYLGLPAVIIVYCLATIELAGRWPSLRWLCRLGDASFSIYLTHIFVLAGLRMLWERLPVDYMDATWALAFLAAAFAGSCVVGVAVYRLVERPLGGITNRVLGLQT